MAKVRKKYDITAREGVKFCAAAIFFLLPQALFRGGWRCLWGLLVRLACEACLWDRLWRCLWRCLWGLLVGRVMGGVAYPCPSLRFLLAKSFSLDSETLDWGLFFEDFRWILKVTLFASWRKKVTYLRKFYTLVCVGGLTKKRRFLVVKVLRFLC